MLGRERSWAEEIASARILKGTVLSAFWEQQDGPQRPGTQGWVGGCAREAAG